MQGLRIVSALGSALTPEEIDAAYRVANTHQEMSFGVIRVEDKVTGVTVEYHAHKRLAMTSGGVETWFSGVVAPRCWCRGISLSIDHRNTSPGVFDATGKIGEGQGAAFYTMSYEYSGPFLAYPHVTHYTTVTFHAQSSISSHRPSIGVLTGSTTIVPWPGSEETAEPEGVWLALDAYLPAPELMHTIAIPHPSGSGYQGLGIGVPEVADFQAAADALTAQALANYNNAQAAIDAELRNRVYTTDGIQLGEKPFSVVNNSVFINEMTVPTWSGGSSVQLFNRDTGAGTVSTGDLLTFSVPDDACAPAGDWNTDEWYQAPPYPGVSANRSDFPSVRPLHVKTFDHPVGHSGVVPIDMRVDLVDYNGVRATTTHTTFTSTPSSVELIAPGSGIFATTNYVSWGGQYSTGPLDSGISFVSGHNWPIGAPGMQYTITPLASMVEPDPSGAVAAAAAINAQAEADYQAALGQDAAAVVQWEADWRAARESARDRERDRLKACSDGKITLLREGILPPEVEAELKRVRPRSDRTKRPSLMRVVDNSTNGGGLSFTASATLSYDTLNDQGETVEVEQTFSGSATGVITTHAYTGQSGQALTAETAKWTFSDFPVLGQSGAAVLEGVAAAVDDNFINFGFRDDLRFPFWHDGSSDPFFYLMSGVYQLGNRGISRFGTPSFDPYKSDATPPYPSEYSTITCTQPQFMLDYFTANKPVQVSPPEIGEDDWLSSRLVNNEVISVIPLMSQGESLDFGLHPHANDAYLVTQRYVVGYADFRYREADGGFTFLQWVDLDSAKVMIPIAPEDNETQGINMVFLSDRTKWADAKAAAVEQHAGMEYEHTLPDDNQHFYNLYREIRAAITGKPKPDKPEPLPE